MDPSLPGHVLRVDVNPRHPTQILSCEHSCREVSGYKTKQKTQIVSGSVGHPVGLPETL